MSIKITPLSLTVRGYNGNIITENKTLNDLKNTPYDFICTVQIVDDVGWISGFMGKLILSNRKLLEKELRETYRLVDVSWTRPKTLINKTK